MIAYNDPRIIVSIILILSLYAVHRFKDPVMAFFGTAYPNARYSAMGMPL